MICACCRSSLSFQFIYRKITFLAMILMLGAHQLMFRHLFYNFQAHLHIALCCCSNCPKLVAWQISLKHSFLPFLPLGVAVACINLSVWILLRPNSRCSKYQFFDAVTHSFSLLSPFRSKNSEKKQAAWRALQWKFYPVEEDTSRGGSASVEYINIYGMWYIGFRVGHIPFYS